METSTERHVVRDPGTLDHDAREDALAESLWRVAGIIVARRWFIIGITGLVAIAAIVISLLLPTWYRSTSRLLLPESGGGLSSVLLRNLPSAASALLGSSGGDYARYLAILTSRSVNEAVVEEFDLVEVYDTDGPAPMEDALKELSSKTDFDIDRDYEFLSISVYDRDPARAAEMANFYVSQLNQVNAHLSSLSAGNYRQYIEKRFLRARADMDSVFDASQVLQEKHGLIDLPAQTESFFEQIGRMRTDALQLQIQYEALRSELGPSNPRVQRLRELVRVADRKYNEALAGGERLLPIPQDSVPEVARQYVSLELERTIQAAILEVIGPIYEQARLQEEQETEAVQVVDRAVPAARKAKPKRSIIVIAATLSAFLLAVLYVLLSAWWRDNHRGIQRRLSDMSNRPGGNGTDPGLR